MGNTHDFLVLGAGNAGMAAATAAREAGKSVALIEPDLIGGTCPNRGCVPKKVLVAAAQALDEITRAGGHHIEVGPARLDWSALIARKRELIGGLPDGMASSLTKRGIELVRGAARFVDAHTLEVDGTRYRADKIVVATGSVPRPLPIDGAEHLATSADVLEMDALPASVVFVGAGVIALELGHVLARAGAKVTMLEVANRPLGNFDAGAVDALIAHTRAVGIDIHTGVRVEAVRRAGDGYEIACTINGEARQLSAARVINGAGRVANVAGLDLERAGATVERGRVKVDQWLRAVGAEHIALAGDVLAGPPQLSPVATYEGKLAAENLLGTPSRVPDYSFVPAAVFAVPAMAMVGKTEAQAREADLDIEVKTSDMTGWLSGKTQVERVAYAKVLVERGSDRIVGAHLVGHGAEDTIHVFSLAIEHGITASQLRSKVYAYPSHSSDIKYLV